MAILFPYPNEKSHCRIQQAINDLSWGQFVIFQDSCYLKEWNISKKKYIPTKNLVATECKKAKSCTVLKIKINKDKNQKSWMKESMVIGTLAPSTLVKML